MADRRRYRRTAGNAGAAARLGRSAAEIRVAADPRGARLDRAPFAAGCRGLRRRRNRRIADRPRWPVRAARSVRCAEPRPARGVADRPQFLLDRHARGADRGGLAARLEIGGDAGRTPRPGIRRLSRAGGAVGLGHRQHAHRRRRHRPSVGADGCASGLGAGERPRDRVRDHAGFGARPAAGRCHAAGVGVFPRRLPEPDRSR